MDFKEYTRLAILTRANLESNVLNDLHMTLGLVTEAGELADVFKKQIAYGVEPDWVNVKEEIGDILWYLAGLCEFHNFDMDEILEKNIGKLMIRYPKKFSPSDAVNRQYDAERSILEGTSVLDFSNPDMPVGWDLDKQE